MKASNNILERQIIRFITIAMALWTMASGIQLQMVYSFTDYNAWLDIYIDDNSLISVIISLQFVIGAMLVYAKIKHNYKFVLISLVGMIGYHFALAGINIYFTKAQGSSFMSYMLIGCLSSILYTYYKKRNKVLNDDRDLLI